jgi:methionyl-tRNA formyltransferase
VTSPYAGAFTTLNDQKLTVWAAEPLAGARPYIGRIPGRIIEIIPEQGVSVLTGDGVLLLKQVQLEGMAIAPADQVLNRISLTLGRK